NLLAPNEITVQHINAIPNFVTTSNTTPFTWGSGDYGSVSISVPVTQFANSTTSYIGRNADTDWAACTFSTLAWQGLGTVTNNLECRKQGSDLLIRGSLP